MPGRRYDFRSGELADDDRVLPEPGKVLPFRSRRGPGWAAYLEARRELRERNAAARLTHGDPTKSGQ